MRGEITFFVGGGAKSVGIPGRCCHGIKELKQPEHIEAVLVLGIFQIFFPKWKYGGWLAKEIIYIMSLWLASSGVLQGGSAGGGAAIAVMIVKINSVDRSTSELPISSRRLDAKTYCVPLLLLLLFLSLPLGCGRKLAEQSWQWAAYRL
jgi:hypothetical protein